MQHCNRHQPQQRWKWHHIFYETRTQILLSCVGLMTIFIAVSVPVIYQVLYEQVNQRLRREISGELQEFREDFAEANLKQVEQLEPFLKQYMKAERVETDQMLLAILDQRFIASSPPDLPTLMQPGSIWMRQWATRPLQGYQSVPDPELKAILHVAEPIKLQGQVKGFFVATHTTADEHQEASTSLQLVLHVMLLLLLLASVLSWVLAGRILQPLRSMASTASHITEFNLSQRIQVKGQGELAEIAQIFNDMMNRLQTAFTSQQNFINDASHELRTPITIIRGHLDLMGDDPDEQAETLSIVNDELNRMNRFVEDLLLLAKSQQPDFIQLESVDLAVLTEELYQKAKVIVGCECQLAAKASGVIQTDRQRLTQAIMNLVQNANQHTPEDGVIELGSSRNASSIRFWVRDTGSGIALDDQERIFERFARASNAPRCSEGAGLGLSIVQAIAAALAGQIELSSQLGKGSTFTLVFPQPVSTPISYSFSPKRWNVQRS